MKRLFVGLLIISVPLLALGVGTRTHTATVNIDHIEGDFDDFRFHWIGLNNQSVVLTITSDTGYVTNIASATYRLNRTGVVYATDSVTVNKSNVTVNIAYTDVPPDNSYELEVYSSDRRTLGQGRVDVSRSLYGDTNVYSAPTSTGTYLQRIYYDADDNQTADTSDAFINYTNTVLGLVTGSQDTASITMDVTGRVISGIVNESWTDARYAATATVAAVSGRVDTVEGRTGAWNTASTDASYSTNWIETNSILADAKTYTDAATNGLASESYVDAATNGLASESYVNAATNDLAAVSYVDAATNGIPESVVAVSSRVDTVEGRTSTWNTASTDASYSTNWIETNSILADAQSYTDAATNSIDPGYWLTNAVGELLPYNTNGPVLVGTNASFTNDSVAEFVGNVYIGEQLISPTNQATANLDMGGNRIINMAAGTSASNAVNLSQLNTVSNYAASASSLAAVSSRVDTVEGRTGTWNTAITDASYSTNWIETNSILADAETYTDAATNGLASESYVDAATNGLASEAYVDSATNSVLSDANAYTDTATSGIPESVVAVSSRVDTVESNMASWEVDWIAGVDVTTNVASNIVEHVWTYPEPGVYTWQIGGTRDTSDGSPPSESREFWYFDDVEYAAFSNTLGILGIWPFDATYIDTNGAAGETHTNRLSCRKSAANVADYHWTNLSVRVERVGDVQ